MAEHSEGGPKPTDFFVGVIDFFAILLPGAILAFVTHKALEFSTAQWLGERVRAYKPEDYLPHGEAAKWALFLVISYVFGHFIFAIGSLLLDDLYDQTYKAWWWKRKRVKELNEIAAKVLEEHFDPLQARVNNQHQDDAGVTKLCIVNERVIQWSEVICRSRNSAASSEIDRAQADSKFFRALVTLQLLSWPVVFRLAPDTYFLREYTAVILLLLAYRLQRFEWITKKVTRWQEGTWRWIRPLLSPFNWFTILLAIFVVRLCTKLSDAIAPTTVNYWYMPIIVISLLLLSVWRFMEQRLKATRLTYEFFIALSEIKSPVEPGTETHSK